METAELSRIRAELEASQARYFDLFDLAPVGYIVLSEKGLILEANLNAATQLGMERKALLNQSINHFIFPQDQAIYSHHQQQLFRTSAPQVCELRMLRAEAEPFWARVEANVEQDPSMSSEQAAGGAPVCRAVLSDISARKRAEEAFIQSEEKFRLLTEKSAFGIYIIQDGKMAYVNPSFAKTFGYSPKEIIGRLSLNDLIHPDDIQVVMRRLQDRLDGEIEKSSIAYKAIKKDGSLIYIEVYGTMIDYQGRPAVMGTLADITERKQMEEALRLERDFAESMIEMAQTIVLVLDCQGRIVRFNPYMEEISGYTLAEVQGKDWFSTLLPERHREPAHTLFLNALEDIYSRGNVNSIVTKNERELVIEWYAKVLKNGQGNVVGVLFIGQDITERNQAEEVLRHLSTHDDLTGLYNRSFFMEEMARLERGRAFPISIVLGDVDHLKETNDAHGHDAGDVLLKRVAEVLAAAFRAEDVVARIGGDEFAVLLPTTNATSAKVSLQRIRRMIQEHNTALQKGGQTPVELTIRLSLGVSTAENSAPLSGVLKEADVAMYREKRGHANSY